MIHYFFSGCKEYEDLKTQRERKKENKKRMVFLYIFFKLFAMLLFLVACCVDDYINNIKKSVDDGQKAKKVIRKSMKDLEKLRSQI